MPEELTPRPDPVPPTVPRKGLIERCFSPVQIPEELPAELAALAARGSLVFVMRSAGLLNFLYLRWLVSRLGLPAIRAAANFRGFYGWLARVRRARRALREAVAAGQSSVVFLGSPSAGDAFTSLVGLQRHRPDRPIFLIPVLLVWSRRAPTLRPRLRDVLFGSPEAPSAFATAIAFLRNRRRAFVRAGRPVELASFVNERASEPDPLLARKVRGALHHHLSRETRAAVGPRLKAPARVREQVLRDRTLRSALADAAAETGRSIHSLTDEAERDLREIASRFSPGVIEVCWTLLDWVFNRLYDGVEVDEEGLARVKRAASQAPLVFCPSHKSHIDYLILPYVLYNHGMTPPHVAAGVNLAFWPLGWLARRGGAFFIRRSIKGDRIYSATLRAYVKHLLRAGFPQEFYLEGGRSRSGKLLFAKTGLFSMEVNAWLEGASQDVIFVPVAIDYEKLLEARAHARELAGAQKQKENLRALLGLPRLLLRRHGRIHLQFGTPISLRGLADVRLGELAGSLTPDETQEPLQLGAPRSDPDPKRRLVQHLANRVARGINEAVTLTPVGLVASALLGGARRTFSADELGRRVDLLRAVASAAGARFAPGLAGAPGHPVEPGPIADALSGLVAEGLASAVSGGYSVPDERRPILDFYRNNVIGHFAPPALVAAALRACGTAARTAEVRARARWLSRLLKLEFTYAVAGPPDPFDESAGTLGRLGLLGTDGERMRAGEPEALGFLSEFTRTFLEAYRVVGESLLASGGDRGAAAELDRAALVNRALELGREGWASGRVVAREAVSKVTFENAVEWLVQQGALVEAREGRFAIDPAWRSGALQDWVREMGRYL